MKKILLLSLLFLAPAFVAAQVKKPVIANEMDGGNYSYGYQLGEELTARQIELRGNVLWQGLYDAIDQAKPQLSEEEMTLILESIKISGTTEVVKTEEEQPGEAKPEAPPKTYRLKGQRFLGENMDKEGVVTLSSGVQYTVLKSGNGKTPRGTDAVLVNYRARSIEGVEFSSSYPLGIPTPEEFKVNQAIPGLAQALKLMSVGDKWEIYIPAQQAYKDTSPMGGQTVIYVLELLEILPEFH